MAMFRINVKKRARILTKAEFKRMLKVVSITREAVRNQLLLCFSFACGLRVTELASITIRDIILIGGRLKHELSAVLAPPATWQNSVGWSQTCR